MTETHDALRAEFFAVDGTFLLQVRGLVWDREAFTRLERLMRRACAEHEGTLEQVLKRWMVGGFWYLSDWLPTWTSHPELPAPAVEFAALRLPVLVEIVPGVVSTYSGAMVWGMVYTDFLGDQQRLVAGELPVDVLKPGGERRSLRWAVVAGASGAVVGMVLLLVLLFLL